METVWEWSRDVRDEACEWCRGRHWLLRLLMWLWLADAGVQHLRDPLYTSLLGGLNLGIHELGHMVFAPFGQFLMVAGGSLLQCLVPFGSVFMFYRQRDFFAIAFAFGWLSTNLFSVATYMADARTMALPLVSPFGSDNLIHDWHWLLDHMNLLDYDTTFAFWTRVLAILSMLTCLAFGGWLLWQMVRLKPETERYG